MKRVFIMIPYKETFISIYKNDILPAIEPYFIIVNPMDELFTGPITENIKQFIKDSDVCIADLTENNANVMYEVALAHSLGKPVILITQGEPEAIPFDIRHHRVLKYDPTPEGLKLLCHSLKQTLKLTIEFGESPTKLLKQMLIPSSLINRKGPYVVAASPLGYRQLYRREGGWRDRPLGTYSDHVGIRGLMQSFGLIYGMHRLPELLNPDDFDDEVFRDPKRPSHIYSIASPKANRLTGLMMEEFFKDKPSKWEFKPDPKSRDLRNPKLLISLNGKPYEPVHRVSEDPKIWDFGLVIRGPHPFDPSYMLMILAGRGARGTEACCLAVTDPECLQKLCNKLADEHIDLDNHKHAFCAVVSICAMKKRNKDGRLEPDASLGSDNETFRVEDLSVYPDKLKGN